MSFVQDSVLSMPKAAVVLPPCNLYSDEPLLETDRHFQQGQEAQRAGRLVAKLRKLNVAPDAL